jgi:hypothetical protein
VVKKEPMQMRPIEIPSTFQENFSPRISGERIAVNTIEKHDVDDIKIMLPKYSDTKGRKCKSRLLVGTYSR